MGIIFVALGCDAALPASRQSVVITTPSSVPVSATATNVVTISATPAPQPSVTAGLPTATSPVAPSPSPHATQILPTPEGTAIPAPINTYPYPSPPPTRAYVSPTPGALHYIPPPATVLTHTMMTKPSGIATPIVWGVQASNVLTLWLGYFSETPAPSILNAYPIIRWDGPLEINSMVASPDGNSLAILLHDTSPESGNPCWLWVFDLNASTLTPIPNAATSDTMYTSFYDNVGNFSEALGYIVGWVDNSHIAIKGNERLGIISKDGASFSLSSLRIGWDPAETALSPDGTTFASLLIGDIKNDGLWLYNTNGSNARKVAGTNPGFYTPRWSPDGKYISSVSSPGPSSLSVQMWLINLKDNSQQLITPQDGWDVNAAWSADGTSLAFLRADGPVTHGGYRYPELESSNVFLTSPVNPAPRQLTTLIGTKNRDLSWVSSGNYILMLSIAGGSDGALHLVAVSASDGKVSPPLASAADGAMVYPLIIK